VKPECTDYSYWWAQFNDPVLNRLVNMAYEQNLPLRIAGLRILEARAQLGFAAGNLFPQQQQYFGTFSRDKISTSRFPIGGAGGGAISILDYFDTWRFGADAAWELDVWGRFRRGIESADANLNAQIENYDDILVLLQAEVALNYIQLRSREELLDWLAKAVEFQNTQFGVVKKKYETGAADELEFQEAKALVETTEAFVHIFEREHREAQNALSLLLGLPPQDLREELGGPGKLPLVPPEIVVGIPADLLRRRPDVRRAEREAAAQSARIGIAEADFYPQISITGTIGREARQFSQLWRETSFFGSVSPGFRWNVLNYGRILNNVRIEEARFQQAVVNYQQTVLQAELEVENAIVGFRQEQERLKHLEQVRQSLEKLVELKGVRFDRGVINIAEYAATQRELVDLMIGTGRFAGGAGPIISIGGSRIGGGGGLIQTRANIPGTMIRVYKALGGGWRTRYHPPRAQPPVAEKPPFQEEPPLMGPPLPQGAHRPSGGQRPLVAEPPRPFQPFQMEQPPGVQKVFQPSQLPPVKEPPRVQQTSARKQPPIGEKALHQTRPRDVELQSPERQVQPGNPTAQATPKSTVKQSPRLEQPFHEKRMPIDSVPRSKRSKPLAYKPQSFANPRLPKPEQYVPLAVR
jgi:NodT family efflux transporter outer membrane factor (OMF) lipoprotein